MPDPNPLFEQLEVAGLLGRDGVQSNRVRAASKEDLFELAEQSQLVTSADFLQPAQTVFEHSASVSLGGGRQPCADLKCRMKRVQELARFAALYSDRVYIRNPLMDHIVTHRHRRGMEDADVRRHFHDDLIILNELRPLIEAGRVVPITPPGNRCPHCLWERDLASEESARLTPEYDRLKEEFFERTTVTVERARRGYKFRLHGPRELMDHAVSFRRDILPRELASPAVRSQLRSGKVIKVGRAAKRGLEFDVRLANKLFQNIIFELVIAQTLNTSYLTEHPLHIEILRRITGDDTVAERNRLIEKYLTVLVPFAGDVPIGQLLKVRDREEGSFAQFRQQLNIAIDDARKEGSLTEARARQIYSDVLAPALTAMDRKVTLASRGLVLNGVNQSIAWIGAISFGVYVGFLPAGLVPLAAALGLTPVLQSATKHVLDKTRADTVTHSEPLY